MADYVRSLPVQLHVVRNGNRIQLVAGAGKVGGVVAIAVTHEEVGSEYHFLLAHLGPSLASVLVVDAVACRCCICKLCIGYNTDKLSLLSCKLGDVLEVISLGIDIGKELGCLVACRKGRSACGAVGVDSLTSECHGSSDIGKPRHDELTAPDLRSLDMGYSHSVAYDDDDVLGILEVIRSCNCHGESLLEAVGHVGDFGLEISLKHQIGNGNGSFILCGPHGSGDLGTPPCGHIILGCKSRFVRFYRCGFGSRLCALLITCDNAEHHQQSKKNRQDPERDLLHINSFLIKSDSRKNSWPETGQQTNQNTELTHS